MVKISFMLIFSLFLSGLLSAQQQYKIEGRILNKATGQGLSYANVRADGTTMGVSANVEGNYEFNLPAGKFKLIASIIGYRSDTVIVTITGNKSNINFLLEPLAIHLPDITVHPGKNPALEIISKAIERKEERAAQLHSYEFEAYTKGVIRANKDLAVGSNAISLDLDKPSDTASLKINGIFENESKGYFKRPDNYKELIVARKTSANLPPAVGALTGGRLVQNFYTDDIRFFDRPLPGPLSKNALKYYYFRVNSTFAIDSTKVYEIYFEPDNPTDPGFKGYVYITDSTFNMVKIDADLNHAANSGGFFERVSIFQQFVPFAKDLYMPIDYRLFIKANLLGLAKVGFELSSIMYNYKINEPIDSDFFNKAILTVLPGADKKDSLYWTRIQSIPDTREEISAYRRIDSMKSMPRNAWKEFSSQIFSEQMSLSDNAFISGPLNIYHFNRVEGHTLDFSFGMRNLIEHRFDTKISISNGFSDRRFKKSFSMDLLTGQYRTGKLSFHAYDNLAILFASSDAYNEFTSTLLALLAKYDFRDYYYTKGFNFNVEEEVLPVLKLNAGFVNRTDNSAVNNSNFSIFERGESYSINPPIYETKANALSFGFNFDFRNYIEDGYFRRRVSEGKSFATFGGGIFLSDKKLLKSSLDFLIYDFNVQGVINTFRSANLRIRVNGIYSDGPVPYQLQYALAGNISATGKNFTFRTVGLNEFFGDRVLAVNIEHNFKDELFRMSRIPVLKDMDLQLTTFLDIAWLNMSEKSKAIVPTEFRILEQPLIEAGFNLGHVLFPISLELAWRLTLTENNSFVIGVNTFIL